MIVLVILGVVYTSFLVSMVLTIIFAKKSATVQRTRTEENIVNHSHTNTVVEVSTHRPSYKRNNLTIDIESPNTLPEDPDAKFIKDYYKVQCFPLLMFADRNHKVHKRYKLIIWFTLLSFEIFVDSLIFSADNPAVSAVISCAISSPITVVLSLILLGELNSRSFSWKLICGYAVCFGIIAVITGLSVFSEVQDENSFISSAVLVLAFEIVIMEPFRTLLKAIGYLIAKDIGFLNSYCENL